MRWGFLAVLLAKGALGYAETHTLRSSVLDKDAPEKRRSPSHSLQTVQSSEAEMSQAVAWRLDCRAVAPSDLIDYCGMVQNMGYASLPLVFLWVVVLMWLLNTTAEVYFVPPLVYWSSLLSLRPGIAGATFVAIGNGAPDSVMMFLAPSVQDALDMVLCGVMCILCVAGGCVLLARLRLRARADRTQLSDKEEACEPLDRRAYINNAAWLALALGYMLWLLTTRRVTLGRALMMPLMYVCYLASLFLLPDSRPPLMAPSDLGPAPPLPGLQKPPKGDIGQLVLWALAWPTYVLRWTLIPPSDYFWDRPRRIFSSLSPVAVLLFCLWSYDLGLRWCVQSPATIAVTLVAALAAAGIFLSSDDGPKVPAVYPATTLLAKASSVLFLLAVAKELTSCCKTVAFYLGVSRFVLESTVVPWGNSLGDIVTGIAMVRQAQSQAAATALFAGPLFNLLVGAGVSMLLVTVQRGDAVVIADESYPSLMMQVGCIAVAASALVLAFAFEKEGGTLWPVAMWSIYMVFIVGVVMAEVDLRLSGQ
ncbi:CCX1 [Symbiodinium natans]|uniref:CCX1 protein n=1 Tax=Symbiodinium natans TaxID=878477 RepID=A0A812PPS9_9DINO|nr:CCX1 [Symbiodinium natans]